MKSKNSFITLFISLIIFSFSLVTAQEKTGVLVLAHGGSESWNETVFKSVEPLKSEYAVEVAFGMADPKTMQSGIDKLEAQGVNKIVVAQLFISSYSPIIRQNEFLLGLRDKLADKPMLMDHSSGGHVNHHSTNKDIELKPLNFKSKIFLTHPLNDHSLVTDILYENINELSESPGNETIILAAHGPNDEEDNRMWVNTLDSIADQIRTKSADHPFKNIFCVTVRDDAPEEIYEMAKENLRNIVNQASKDGNAIVVPVLLSKGGIEKGIVKRLEGLKYEWNGKTLLPHQNITKFLKASVENALKGEAKL